MAQPQLVVQPDNGEFAPVQPPVQQPPPQRGLSWLSVALGAVFGGGIVAVIAALASTVVVLAAALIAVLLFTASPDEMPPIVTSPVTTMTTGTRTAVAPPLDITVNVTGKKTFEVVNLSKRDYTNVTVVMNGEYQYRLKKLNASAGDSMRYGNFVSRRSGAPPTRKVRLSSLTIQADQGSWSRRF